VYRGLYLITRLADNKRMALKEKITDLIGNTPLVKINRINSGGAAVYAKLEYFNPLHSIKDRTALAMIEEAEKSGALRGGMTIIEPTSGNTGISLAYIAGLKGYRVILTMPDTMSVERRRLLAALGAELELTPGSEGMSGAIARAERLCVEIPHSFMLRQFDNPANPAIHEKTTGPEIWEDTRGKVDILVCGAGTGGTVSGTGRFLKQKNPRIRVIAVEPSNSPVLSGGEGCPHRIQGIGAGFKPKNYDESLVDEICLSDENEAAAIARRLAREEGIFAGISSGAAMDAALRVAKRPENTGKTIVVILPDSGERYLSTGIWDRPENSDG
jgi:cysteine synthase A